MILFIIILFLIVLVLESASLKRGARGISCEIKLSKTLAEQDEHLTITTSVKNTRKTPVNYLRVTELYPAKINLHGDHRTVSNSEIAGSSMVSSVVFLPAKKSVDRVVDASFSARGRYMFHGVHLVEGDFLGFREMTNTQSMYLEVVVLPKPYRNPALTELLGGFLGDHSVRRFIYEDPILTLGFREYTGREPMKSISWTQSAKVGELTVKNYDYTTEVTVSVILNAEFSSSGYSMTKAETEVFERALSVARTVCETLNEKNISFSFTSNMMTGGRRLTSLSLNSAFGSAHLTSVLENLGRGLYGTTEPFTKTLYTVEKSASHGRSCVIITPKLLDEYKEPIARLKRSSGGCHIIEVCDLPDQD